MAAIQTTQFAYWLSSVPSDKYLCETVQFWIPDTSKSYAFANRIKEPTTFISPDGEHVLCQPAAFAVSLPLIESNGTVELSVAFVSTDFEMFNFFENLDGSDLDLTVELYYCAFLLPDGENTPLLNVYPQFYVNGATLSYKSLMISAATRRLPNRKAGLSYNVDDFPGLDIDY